VALRRTLIAGLVVAAGLAAGGCGEQPGPLASPQGAQPPALYAVGAKVFGLRGGPARMASPPVAPLAGWLTPAAVPSADLRYLAYNVWDELRHDDPALSWSDQGIEPGEALATPSIRLYDAASGTDRLLERGAFSLAWRGDGALAYFKGAERDYRAGVRYVGDIVVRSSLEAAPEVWSPRRARYIVAAWAAGHLVAYREREGEALDVVALDGPGRMRVLARDSALVATSPDGRRIFVEEGPAEGHPLVRILRVADGKQVAALDLTKVNGAVGAVGYSGDWRGDRVVAPSASGVVVFRVTTKGIVLEQALRTRARALAEPRFADDAGAKVKAWTSTRAGGVFVDCDRTARRCGRATPLPEARGVNGFPVWRRPLYNPSRPLEGS
jgi:hypothetical protein